MRGEYALLVEGWAHGELSDHQRQQLAALLASGELKQEELEAYRNFSKAVSQAPVPEPSNRLRYNFYQMLAETEESKPSLWVKIAAWFNKSHISLGQLTMAAALLLLGLATGYTLGPVAAYQNQISQLQKQVFSLQQTMLLSQLEGQNATERLKAVNLSQELPNADQQLIYALFKTLNGDPSINVRLAAIEALHRHAKHELVREGLVRSLLQQESALVLIALADELALLQEKRAIQPIQELLKDKNLDSSAGQQLERTLKTLI